MLANMRWQHHVVLFACGSTTSCATRKMVWGVMMTIEVSASRQRMHRLRVLVLPDEEERIKENAANCALSVSAYLRRLGLHYQPKSVLDYKAVLELSKVNADQGRLGGLVKMWLSNGERFGVDEFSMEQNLHLLLGELVTSQAILLEKVRQL